MMLQTTVNAFHAHNLGRLLPRPQQQLLLQRILEHQQQRYSSKTQRRQMTSGGDGEMEEKSSATTSTTVSSIPEEFKNKNNIRDQVVSMISGDGGVKVTAATTRNLVNDASILHSLTTAPTDALSRAMTTSLLLSNGMQHEQTFQLTINGDGPIRGVVAIAKGSGEVRGYVGNSQIGEMPLQEAIGSGTVNIVKNHPDWPRPYNGITSIQNGDIDRDVGVYLAQSEQRSCALAAGTSIKGLLCTSAGGYVVEQLPDCTSETIAKVEENLQKLIEKDGTTDIPTGILIDGGTPLDICSIILDELDMQPLQQIEPKWFCGCSEEKLFRAIRLLPRTEVDDIVESQQKLEARCEFCGTVYSMTAEQVKEKFATAKGDPALDEDFEG